MQSPSTEWHCDLSAPARSSLQYSIRKIDTHSRHSVFAGEPRPELDQAWSKLLRGMHHVSVSPVPFTEHHSIAGSMIRLSEDEMRVMNKTSIALKDGSGYIGYLESYHMLHCVVSEGTSGASIFSHRFLETLVPVVVSRVLHRSRELREAEHPASW